MAKEYSKHEMILDIRARLESFITAESTLYLSKETYTGQEHDMIIKEMKQDLRKRLSEK